MNFTRVLMYEHIKAKLPRIGPKWLSISSDIRNLIPKSEGVEVTSIKYPQGDWCYLPHNPESFDFVFSDQVLEHVKNPQAAVDETYRVLNPGGVCVCTTCSFNPVHKFPEDYWRFTIDGLRVLFENFKIISTGSWGSRAAICHLTEVDMDRTISDRNRYLIDINEPAWPIHVWIVAQK